MKRYIRYISASSEPDLVDPSLFAGTPFTYEKASGYEDFLNSKELKYYQEHKNKTGSIVMMSPNEYIDECAYKVFKGRTTPEKLKESRYWSKTESGDSLIDSYVNAMKSGSKFPLCYIDYTGGQEGLHRMIAAGVAYGWDTKFPVLVVEPYDKDKYYVDSVRDICYDFIKYGDFKYICENGVYSVALNNPQFSEDLIPDICNNISEEAVNYKTDNDEPYDIDVTAEIEEADDYAEDYHYLCIYITRYADCQFTERYPGPIKLLVEDYFDTPNKSDNDNSEDDIFDQVYEDKLKEAEAAGLDLDDPESIVKYFLK